MDCSMPSFPVLPCLPEFTQAQVHWVGEAIQPSHPLLPPFPLALNLTQYQGLFQWINSSHQVAKVLELQLQHQSFQRKAWQSLKKNHWLKYLILYQLLKTKVHTSMLPLQIRLPIYSTRLEWCRESRNKEINPRTAKVDMKNLQLFGGTGLLVP